MVGRRGLRVGSRPGCTPSRVGVGRSRSAGAAPAVVDQVLSTGVTSVPSRSQEKVPSRRWWGRRRRRVDRRLVDGEPAGELDEGVGDGEPDRGVGVGDGTVAGVMMAGCQAWFVRRDRRGLRQVHTEPKGTSSVTTTGAAPAVVDQVLGTGVTSVAPRLQVKVPANTVAGSTTASGSITVLATVNPPGSSTRVLVTVNPTEVLASVMVTLAARCSRVATRGCRRARPVGSRRGCTPSRVGVGRSRSRVLRRRWWTRCCRPG